MIVTLVKPSGEPVTLAQGRQRGVDRFMGPDFQGNAGNVVVQPIPLLRASAMSHELRGNFATRLSFRVSIEKADELAAVMFWLSWPTQVPREGEIRFTETTEEEGRSVTARIASAKIESAIMGPLNGVSTTVTYVIVGGPLEILQ